MAAVDPSATTDTNTVEAQPFRCPDEGTSYALTGLVGQYLAVRKKAAPPYPDKLVETARAVVQLLLAERCHPHLLFRFERHSGPLFVGNQSVASAFPDLLHTIAMDFSVSSPGAVHAVAMLELFSSIASTPDIPDLLKLQALVVEARVFGPWYWSWLLGTDVVSIRRHFRRREHFLRKRADAPDPDGAAVQELFGQFVRSELRLFVGRGDHLGGLHLLVEALEANRNCPALLADVARRLILYNNLYGLVDRETVLSWLDPILPDLSSDARDSLLTATLSTFDKVEFRDCSFDQQDHRLQHVDLDRVTTFIEFVIPRPLDVVSTTREAPDGVVVVFSRMDSLLQDPVFQFLDQLDARFNEMPAGAFSDGFPDHRSCTAVTVIIPKFFHPEFDLADGEIRLHDYTDESARTGRAHDPVKAAVIDLLRALRRSDNTFPLSLALEEINANLFSAYLVNHKDWTGKSAHHRVALLTNVERYREVVQLVGESRTRRVLSDFADVRAVVHDAFISTESTLRTVARRMVECTFKRAVEQRGIWKRFWEGGRPISEPDAQPLVVSHMADVFAIKGIHLSREEVLANGELDFHCSFTARDGRLLKTCIEMKNAHHGHLFAGIERQLPAYMLAERSRDGIFLVLWYKDADFAEPRAHQSVASLRKCLEERVPPGLRIDVVIVDCTKPQTPSTLR